MHNSKSSIVYLIFCLVDDRRYVGSSTRGRRRWAEHRHQLRKGIHDNNFLQKAFSKYGEATYQFSILEVVADPAKLLEREQFWIDTIQPEYNLASTAGSAGLGHVQSDEEKESHAAHKRQYWASLDADKKAKIRENIGNGVREFWANLTEEEKLSAKIRRSTRKSKLTEDELRERFLKRQAVVIPHDRSNPDPALVELIKKRKADTIAKNAPKREATNLRAIQRWRDGEIPFHSMSREAQAMAREEFEAGRADRERLRREKISSAKQGTVMSEEAKDKLRAANAKQFADPVKRAAHQASVAEAMKDPETLRRLSESHMGLKQSEAQKQKNSALHTGRKRSEQTKQNLRVGRKRAWDKQKAAEAAAQSAAPTE